MSGGVRSCDLRHPSNPTLILHCTIFGYCFVRKSRFSLANCLLAKTETVQLIPPDFPDAQVRKNSMELNGTDQRLNWCRARHKLKHWVLCMETMLTIFGFIVPRVGAGISHQKCTVCTFRGLQLIVEVSPAWPLAVYSTIVDEQQARIRHRFTSKIEIS